MMKRRVILLIVLCFLIICTCLLLSLAYRVEDFVGAVREIIVSDSGKKHAQYITEGLCYGNVQVENTFCYKIAERAADLILRVATQTPIPGDLTVLKTLLFQKKRIGVMLLDPGGTVWIVFRGTSTKQEWEHDFDFVHADFLVEEKTFRCARGFIGVFSEVYGQVKDELKNRTCDVVVTGHSLGAALATLCAGALVSHPAHYVQCYNFGGPRVCFDLTLPARTMVWRINNTCDIVQQLPLAVMWNTRSKRSPYKYTHLGRQVNFTTNYGTLQENHTMPVYIEAIRDRLLCIQTPVSYA